MLRCLCYNIDLNSVYRVYVPVGTSCGTSFGMSDVSRDSENSSFLRDRISDTSRTGTSKDHPISMGPVINVPSEMQVNINVEPENYVLSIPHSSKPTGGTYNLECISPFDLQLTTSSKRFSTV
jgi:hypothetical protein